MEWDKLVERWRIDPVAYVHDCLDARPEPEQEKILRALTGKKPIAAKSGHGIGKTAVESWIILWAVHVHPHARVPCTAPTNHQLHDILWPEVGKWLKRGHLDEIMSMNANRLSMRGHEETWFATPRSCDVPENLQGFHGDYLFFVVDEASGVPDPIFQVIWGALTTENAHLIMTGNPTKLSGQFFHAFGRDRASFETFTFNAEESRLVSAEYCQRIAQQFGRESDVYKVRVLGQFPGSTPDSFIPLSRVEMAMGRKIEAGGKIQIGIDPARYGDDHSVICIRRGLQVLPFIDFQGINTVRLAAETAAAVRKLRKDYDYKDRIMVCIDDTGVGGGVTDNLQVVAADPELNLEIMPINFGEASDNPDYFGKPSEMWATIREALDTISIPEDAELASQLSTRKYKVRPDGKIQLESKDEMRRRGVSSPDKGDALGLAYTQGKRIDIDFC